MKSDVRYSDLSEKNVLDIFTPEGESLETAVIQLHGGAFRRGRKEAVHPRAQMLSSLGFTVLPTNYRLLPDNPWPSAPTDVANAIAWTRENAAELGVRPDRIVVQGFSAGGYLALLSAIPGGLELRPGADDAAPAVAAAVAMYPVTTIHASSSVTPEEAAGNPPREDGAQDAVGMFGRPTSEAEVLTANPEANVSARWAPTFLGHGTADWTMPPSNTARLHRLLTEAGAVSELHMYAGQIHEFEAGGTYLDLVSREVAVFLRRTLVEPEAFEQEQMEFNPFANGTIPRPVPVA